MTTSVPRRPGASSGAPPGALSGASSVEWSEARRIAHDAGATLPLAPREEQLHHCDGRVLAQDVIALTDLPPFDASMVDGYAVRGPGPWRIGATVPAGTVPKPLAAPGTGVRIATGAMVPQGTDAILRIEDAADEGDGLIRGTPGRRREWRSQAETAHKGAVLVPAGALITPGVIGTAASAGHDTLLACPRPRMAIVVIGGGLATSGPPGAGRIRDALGPQLPAWAARLGFEVTLVLGPVPDEAEACRDALARALATGAELLVTVGGSGYGPEDHLRGALESSGAERLIDSVQARPGKPLRLARLAAPRGGDGRQGASAVGGGGGAPAVGEGLHGGSAVGREGARSVLVVGLPGNPQPAILGLLLLAVPAAAGMTRRPLPPLATVVLGSPIAARGAGTRMALCYLDAEGRAHPVEREAVTGGRDASAGPVGRGVAARVPGLAGAAGFAVVASGVGSDVASGVGAVEGERVPFLPLPVQ